MKTEGKRLGKKKSDFVLERNGLIASKNMEQQQHQQNEFDGNNIISEKIELPQTPPTFNNGEMYKI